MPHGFVQHTRVLLIGSTLMSGFGVADPTRFTDLRIVFYCTAQPCARRCSPASGLRPRAPEGSPACAQELPKDPRLRPGLGSPADSCARGLRGDPSEPFKAFDGAGAIQVINIYRKHQHMACVHTGAAVTSTQCLGQTARSRGHGRRLDEGGAARARRGAPDSAGRLSRGLRRFDEGGAARGQSCAPDSAGGFEQQASNT